MIVVSQYVNMFPLVPVSCCSMSQNTSECIKTPQRVSHGAGETVELPDAEMLMSQHLSLFCNMAQRLPRHIVAEVAAVDPSYSAFQHSSEYLR